MHRKPNCCCYIFDHYRRFHRSFGVFADCEHAVLLEQHGWRAPDAFEDRLANGFVADERKASAWDRTAEFICNRSEHTRNGSPQRCKSRGIARVRVRHTTYIRPVAIDIEVAIHVGRGLVVAIHDAPFHINNDHVLGAHRLISNAARFDHHQPCLGVTRADVAPCPNHEVVAPKLLMEFDQRFTQSL